MSQTIIKISEGLTYEYLPQALGVGLLGVLLTAFLHWACFPVIMASFLIGASQTGVEINVNSRRMRKYTSWTLFSTGEWIEIDNISQIELGYDGHGHTTRAVIAQQHTSAKTFDLKLNFQNGKELLFNQFLKIGLAVKTYDQLTKMLPNVPAYNHVKTRITNKKAQRTR